MMPNPTTSTVERGRLVEALDTLADVAHAIERVVDDGRPLDDADDLIAPLRGVISDLAFDLEAPDFLSTGGSDAQSPAAVPPIQQPISATPSASSTTSTTTPGRACSISSLGGEPSPPPPAGTGVRPSAVRAKGWRSR